MSDTEPQSVRDVLVAARAEIADPGRWCGDGPYGDGGTRCAATAVQKVLGYEDEAERVTEEIRARYKATCHALCAGVGLWLDPDEIGASRFGEFNDTHTHTEVLAAFDTAIAAQESA